jgi:hypothetical protein
MRIIAILITVVLLVPVASPAQVTSNPPTPEISGLLVGSRIEEYFGETYTTRSRESFVFFQGEPVSFRVIVRNMSPRETSLIVGSTDASQLFRVQGFVANSSAPESRPGDSSKYLDQRGINLPIGFSLPIQAWAGGVLDVPLARETVLEAGESIQWLVGISSAGLDAGLYRVVIRVNGTERGGRPLQGFVDFGFEVRARSAEAQPEILRREASRRLSRADYAGARQAVADLLRVHPNSAIAHDVLASVADAEGRKDEAANHRRNVAAVVKR